MIVVVCTLIGVDLGCSLILRNYLESNFYRYSEKFRFRERCERVLFFYNGKGLFSNPLIAFTFSTEFCDAKMNVYSFLFVCLCTRLEFSSHASFFLFLFAVVFLREVKERA